jgi:Sigma-70 region 2
VTEDPFVAHRSLLFTVAYEMLGSAADAEDVLQESWLRWADVVLIADGGGLAAAALAPIHGAELVARLLARANRAALETTIVWLNGAPAGRVEIGGQLAAVSLVVEDGRITRIYATANPQKLTRLDEPADLAR